MIKGILWLLILSNLMGLNTSLIALILFVVILGTVVKLFIAPFTSVGPGKYKVKEK